MKHILSLLAIILLFPASSSSKGSSHTLFIGLDGISYQVMKEMYDGGYFRNFTPPIPMIATFPTISDPNWAHITQTPVEKSYTKAHFDMNHKKGSKVGKPKGSLIDHVLSPPQYESFFDDKPEGPLEHLAMLNWSYTSTLFWVDRIPEKVLAQTPPKRLFSTFSMNTDIESHISGKKAILKILKRLDRKLRNLQKDFEKKHMTPLKIVLVSDHGNYYNNPKRIDFEKTLEKKKWKWTDNLKDKNNFAFVAPEIISFGAFYTLKGQEHRFAKDISSVEGVHVSLSKGAKNQIHVFSEGGKNHYVIHYHPKKKTISYTKVNGEDPFNQIQYFKKKKRIAIKDYLNLSAEHQYPHALLTAWEGFYKNAQTPASVLVCVKLGYVFTNFTLELLTKIKGLKSTHGSFNKQEAMGVFMSTDSHLESFIRPDNVKKHLK